MKIQETKPIDRFTKTSFIYGIDWLTHPPSVFSCERCGQEVVFVLNDFLRHYNLSFTNFSTEDDYVFRLFQENTLKKAFNSFLDFYCPKCTTPIRVYYRCEELVGSQRRAWGVEITAIGERI